MCIYFDSEVLKDTDEDFMWQTPRQNVPKQTDPLNGQFFAKWTLFTAGVLAFAGLAANEVKRPVKEALDRAQPSGLGTMRVMVSTEGDLKHPDEMSDNLHNTPVQLPPLPKFLEE